MLRPATNHPYIQPSMIGFKSLGVSITTYSDKHTTPQRYAIIKNCLKSLAANTPKSVTVHIVSDGITERHRNILKEFPQFKHIERSYNGGVAKAKNTSIKELLESGVDIGFLADDDMVFLDSSVFHQYARAIEITGIPHFSLFQESRDIIKTHKNIALRCTPYIMGCFLTFTKELIEDIGYFRILPYKYGHEHSNFSLRCGLKGYIPFFCDIINSRSLVCTDTRGRDEYNSLSGKIDMPRMKENERLSHQDLDRYEPCIE